MSCLKREQLTISAPLVASNAEYTFAQSMDDGIESYFGKAFVLTFTISFWTTRNLRLSPKSPYLPTVLIPVALYEIV